MAFDLAADALQVQKLRDIEDLLPIYVDPDEASRRMYWLLLEQRVAAAVRVGCCNQDIWNSCGIARGLAPV